MGGDRFPHGIVPKREVNPQDVKLKICQQIRKTGRQREDKACTWCLLPAARFIVVPVPRSHLIRSHPFPSTGLVASASVRESRPVCAIGDPNPGWPCFIWLLLLKRDRDEGMSARGRTNNELRHRMPRKITPVTSNFNQTS